MAMSFSGRNVDHTRHYNYNQIHTVFICLVYRSYLVASYMYMCPVSGLPKQWC